MADLGPGGEILSAIDRVDDLAHNARAVPLTDQVRISSSDLDAAVSDIQAAAVADGLDSDRRFAPALARLMRVASEATAIPLTDHVACDREEIYDALDVLRAQIPQSLLQARWKWKEAGGGTPPSADEIAFDDQ